jgi:hypothetical protein
MQWSKSRLHDKDSKDRMDIVRIIQRFHSLFYTPQFVAMHLGVLAQEELRVEVSLPSGEGELRGGETRCLFVRRLWAPTAWWRRNTTCRR